MAVKASPQSLVRQAPLQKMISATAAGKEKGFLDGTTLDLDVGDTNDFLLKVRQDMWKKERLWYDFQIYIPNTEYGGLIEDLEVLTKEKTICFYGHTWRGLLTRKIVEPPAGEDYLILNGELNVLVGQLVGNRFGSLFTVDSIDSGVTVSNWRVNRYVTLYDAIIKLLDAHGFRLNIAYHQGVGNGYGAVHLSAVPVVDWSEQLEYSKDSRLHFRIRDSRKGINHLICLGAGELKERKVLHLYAQENGTVGEAPYYTGLQERTAVYDSTEEDMERLRTMGTDKLKELRNYKKIEMVIDDMNLEIGDIVGGMERITGTHLKQPVVRKILNISNGRVSIDYKIKGDE